MLRYGDPGILGTTISLSGDQHVIIGVIGPSFNTEEFGPAPEVWIPFQVDPNTADQGHFFQVAARLQPGVTLEQAQARMPLESQIMIGGGVMKELATEQPRQIIGVVGDLRDAGLNNDPQPRMYVPQAQVPDALNALNVRITPVAWVVRTLGDPYSVSSAVQEQLRQVSGLPVSDVRSMDDVVSRSISRQRFNVMLMSVFGGSALLLAAIGIYGLMAYSVQQRTREIGIRMALGAEADQVRRMVVFQGMRLAVAGVVVGLAAAFFLTRVIASFLYGVQPRDPAVFIGIPLLLTAVSLIAVYLPARRASAVDPLAALRYE